MNKPSQTTFAEAGFEAYRKPTRRERFLADMERVVPWAVLFFLSLVASGCSKAVPELIGAAKVYQARGDFSSAIIQLKNALGQQPDNVEAHSLIGLSYAEVGETLDAERELHRALELGAPPARILPMLGRVLIESEQYKQAIDEMRKAKNLGAETMAQISLLIAQAQLGLGAFSEARTQYYLAANDKPAEAKLGLARVAAAEGDRKTAYTLTEEVLAGAPTNAEAWLVKGDLLRGDSKNQEALSAYQQASTISPANVIARLSQAVTYIGLGKYAEARAEIVHAQKLAPANAMLHFTRAVLALRERRFEECADDLQAVFRLIPKHMPSVLMTGALFFATNQMEQAQNAFFAYLSRYPRHIYARKMLAATLLRKAQPQSAVYLLEPLMPHVKGDAELLAIAGQAYLQIGEVRKAREYLEKAVALDPDNADTRTRLGMTQLAAGNRQEGVTELESAVALNPGDSRADHLLIMTLVAQNETEKALQAVQQLEKRRPDKPDTHFLKGAVYRAKQDWASARASFEHALKLQPVYFPAAASLAQLDMRDNKPDAARGRMEAILKHDARNLDAMLLLARMELEAGHRAEAIAWLRKAAADHPQSMQSYLMLAQVQMQSGQSSDALTAARQAREMNPKDPRAVEVLGNAQMAAGDTGGAISSFTSLATMLPNSVQAQLKLADAYIANGDFRDANAVVRRALQLNPENLDAKAALVEILLRTKRYPEATELAQQMQKQDPKRAQGYILEGEAWMIEQEYARAASAYEKADALQPNGLLRMRLHQAQSRLGKGAVAEAGLLEWIKTHPEDVDTRSYVAEIENKAGHYKAAAEHYRAILKLNPKDVRALNNLAWTLLQDGDPKALDYAQQAFQLKPNDPVVADTLGWAMVSQGNLYEGLQIMAKAVSLDTENPEIRYHLVQALARAGDTSRARGELKTLLASGKKFAQVEEARALLQRLGP